jgi:hypothetical protein
MNLEEELNVNEKAAENFVITEDIIEECVSGALEE